MLHPFNLVSPIYVQFHGGYWHSSSHAPALGDSPGMWLPVACCRYLGLFGGLFLQKPELQNRGSGLGSDDANIAPR